jgi:glycosyltransferase involved in cell wall biosynthesis
LLDRRGVKVLLCHNFYQQRGGEDESVEDEAALLLSYGHEVVWYRRDGSELDRFNAFQLARASLWNRQTYDEVRALIARERPDVVHCTNTVPLISPSVYDAAHDEGTAVVQGLRNYRFVCPGGLLLRNGRVCESCLDKRVAWPAVVHGCYRDSRVFSAGMAATLAIHRARNGWTRNIDMYFAPSEFTRSKYVQAGLPADRIGVSPHWIHPDPGAGTGEGGFVVFVGRLSKEKGIETLLEAWKQVRSDARLRIVGDGPLAGAVTAAAAADPRIEWVGRQTHAEVLEIVGEALCLVLPSITYETFGRTIGEAFSRGTPVVVSGSGAMAELVDDGRTGYHAAPGDARDLTQKIGRMLGQPPDARARMRDAARQEYLRRFTAAPNYDRLIEIYERARDFRRARRSAPTWSASPLH